MTLAYNAHRVFHEAPNGDDYLAAITIDDTERKRLTKVRDEIRAELKTGFGNWSNFIRAQDLFERRFAVHASTTTRLAPKFRMQGSFAYHTVNAPAKCPPQQVDLDDGVYLPTSFISDDGNRHPLVASNGFFAAVEAVLKPLCDRKGWKLKEKDTCVRVEISAREHIDLPLYAIPDEEFVAMEKAFASRMVTAAADSAEFSEAFYRELPRDQIMLAHRKEGWKESDPRKIEDWFQDAITDFGPALRRVCRYLKGWRDHTWGKSPLSSIAIMQCTVIAFEELNGTLPDNRDDFALLKVAERLPEMFSKRIENPVINDQYLNDDWDEEQRAQIVTAATQLHQTLDLALARSPSSAVSLGHIVSLFGERVPDDEGLVKAVSEEAKIMAYKASSVAAPVVGRTTSG